MQLQKCVMGKKGINWKKLYCNLSVDYTNNFKIYPINNLRKHIYYIELAEIPLLQQSFGSIIVVGHGSTNSNSHGGGDDSINSSSNIRQ